MRHWICMALGTVLLSSVVTAQVAELAQANRGEDRNCYIVHFRRRSFDLSAYRQAILDQRPAKIVAEIIEGLERSVRADQAGFVAKIEKLQGRVVAQWWLINACAVELPGESVTTMSRWDEVERIEEDQLVQPARPRRVHALPVMAPAWIKTATNKKNHDADALHALKVTGLGVTTAIMDTGHDVDMGGSKRPHRVYYVNGDPKNLSGGGIAGSRLLVNRKLGLLAADDPTGHGTSVASVVAGEDWGTTHADRSHAFGAKIAGYAIADAASGGSNFTTMINAWQAIASDRAKLGIVTVNMSYAGSSNPLHASQKALDSAAYNGDLLVVVAAGNLGKSVSFSQICVNGLSVGAVNADSKTMASFSSHGLPDGQLYPDLCANGVNVIMAQRDLESSDKTWSGTSFASPQVCGAATQLRAAVPKLRADEVKAILLATTEKSPLSGSKQVSTGPGCGYLKNDVAYASAIRSTRHGRVQLTASNPSVRIKLPVKQGQLYQVALAWHRMNVNSATWSNIDLQIVDAAKLVIVSNTKRNTEEFVRFQAAKSGDYIIEIRATSLSAASQDVAWATNADVSLLRPGQLESYGSACQGTRLMPSPAAAVFPKAQTTSFGGSSSYFGFGRGNQRYQQVLLASESPVAMRVTGYSLRQDDSATGTTGGSQSYTVFMGYTSFTPKTLTSTFAKNFNTGTKPVQIFSGTVKLPTWTGSNTKPASFGFGLKFTKPWIHIQKPGQNILIDIQNSSSSHILQFADAVSGSQVPTTRLYSFSVAATTGTLVRNSGLVIRLDSLGGSVPVSPLLSANALPRIGKVFRLDLGRARSSTAAALMIGSSHTSWASIPLPWSLAPFGGQSCSLQTSIDLIQGLATDAQGAGSMPLMIPNDKRLSGIRFYNQFLVIDPGANPLGLSFTQGAQATIGG